MNNLKWDMTCSFKLNGSLTGYDKDNLKFKKYLENYSAFVVTSGSYYNGYIFKRIYELPEVDKYCVETVYFKLNA